MKLDDLTTEHIIEVHRLYEEHVGSQEIDFERRMYCTPDGFLKELKGKRRGENYRIGSRWTFHSKLEVGVDNEGNISFEFYENFDSRNREGERYDEAVAGGRAFESAVETYLKNIK